MRETVSDKVVRCEVTQEEINSGKSKVFVVVGFCVGEQKTQLTYYCGDSLLGSDNTEAGADVAEAVLVIDRACVENGLEFRRGVFQ